MLAVLSSTAPVQNAHAADVSNQSFSWSRINSDATILGCIGTCHADLTIPSIVGGYTVRSIGPSAFKWAGLRSVVIPDTVKTIGAYAFINNPSLSVLTIGRSVESIGQRAFSRTSLTAVVLGDSVTSIGDYAFEFSPIATLDLGGSIKSIGRGAFQHSSLTSVVIPDSVTVIGQQAFGSSRLASLTIGQSVTTIGPLAFAWNRLTSLVIPASVVVIERGAFQTNMLVSVRFMGNAPNPLQDVRLRNCNDKNGTVFRGNPNLSSVIISADKKGYLSCWDGVSLLWSLDSLFMVRANANVDGVIVAYPNTKSVALDTVGQWSSQGAVSYSENDADCDINGRTLIILQVGDGRCDVTATLAAWRFILGATDSVEVLIRQQPDSQAAATVKPAVTGTSAVGWTLTAAKGTWIGYPTPTFAYQWYACTKAVSAASSTVPATCKKITGATKSTFKLTSAQRGQYVAVVVTGTSLRTTATTWLSKTTAKVK
jgi:hypothetical protein